MNYQQFEHDFLHKYLPLKHKDLRNGQGLYNYLHDVAPILANKINATEFDCFYVDSKIPKTLKWLEENWLTQYPTIEESLINFMTKMLVEHEEIDYFKYEVVQTKYCSKPYYYIGTFTNTELSNEYCVGEVDFTLELDDIYGGVNAFFGSEDPKIHVFSEKATIYSNTIQS